MEQGNSDDILMVMKSDKTGNLKHIKYINSKCFLDITELKYGVLGATG